MKPQDATIDELNRQLDAYSAATATTERNNRNRWGKWPFYAAATGAALAGASAASADIIYSGTLSLSGHSLNVVFSPNHSIDFGVATTIRRHFVSTTTFNGNHISSENLLRERGVIDGGDHVRIINPGGGSLLAAFPRGALISPHISTRSETGPVGSDYSVLTHQGQPRGTHTPRGNFQNGAYLGFEIYGTKAFVSTGAMGSGWIHVQFSAAFPGTFDVTGFAYNTDGGIDAGQTQSATPEPGTLALMLLATGAAGVLAWKRRRNQTQLQEGAW